MSIGETYGEQGLLLRQRHSLILQRDDGDCWRLSANSDVNALRGARVRVEGSCADFDLRDVHRIGRC
jgi:hypothetical protein